MSGHRHTQKRHLIVWEEGVLPRLQFL